MLVVLLLFPLSPFDISSGRFYCPVAISVVISPPVRATRPTTSTAGQLFCCCCLLLLFESSACFRLSCLKRGDHLRKSIGTNCHWPRRCPAAAVPIGTLSVSVTVRQTVGPIKIKQCSADQIVFDEGSSSNSNHSSQTSINLDVVVVDFDDASLLWQ